MELKDITILRDRRSHGYSIMAVTNVESYLEFIVPIFKSRGAIDGQRDVIQKSSDVKKGRRLAKDIAMGALFPPVVIGWLVDKALMAKFNTLDEFEIAEKDKNEMLSSHLDPKSSQYSNFSLIDGMQRTNALLRAIEENPSVLKMPMRVELWVADHINDLIYRMLVLNTGQSPWNLAKQIDVMYSTMLRSLEEYLPEAEFLPADRANERKHAGQYPNKSVVELFMVFGTRKEKQYLRENVAEDYVRLDFTENIEKLDLFKLFERVFDLLFRFDLLLAEVYPGKHDKAEREKYQVGSDLFASQPARIGFMTAMGIKILGRQGVEKPRGEVEDNIMFVEDRYINFSKAMKEMPEEKLKEFLAFDVLNETLNANKPSKVGDFERSFFTQAFRILIDTGFEVESLKECWTAF